jgi:hypothetical protein
VASQQAVVDGAQLPQPLPSMQATEHVMSEPHAVPVELQVCATLPAQRTAPGLQVHLCGALGFPPHVKPASQALEQLTATPQLLATVVPQSSPGSPEQVTPSGSSVQQVPFPRQTCPVPLQATPPLPAAEQLTEKPQRSVMVPHLPAQSPATSRVQLQVCDVPSQLQFGPFACAQVSPQLTVAPQLFVTVPHFPWQVLGSGVQALQVVPEQPYVQA